MLLAVLALQSASATTPIEPGPKLQAVKPCPPVAAGEVVVCGRREVQEQYRLRALPDKFVDAPVRAERKLGAGTVGIETEEVRFGNGTVSKRAMVRLKLPF